jgi:hypothetical protein
LRSRARGGESGDERLRERALIARRYVYRGQHEEGERLGGWAHMVSGEWGGDHQVNFTRITGPLPPVDGVDTAIIINLLCTAIEAGLEPDVGGPAAAADGGGVGPAERAASRASSRTTRARRTTARTPTRSRRWR